MLKILFLDRDGIINVDKGYIYKVEDMEFVDGLENLLSTAKKSGFQFIVVTNQAGIDKGMYAERDVDIFHKEMARRLLDKGFEILDFFFCPHHPNFSGDCDCRKPQPGMLLKAKEKYGINMQSSVMIGDKSSDVSAGKNAGIGKTILVSSQYIAETVKDADFFAKNLYEAADYIKECCGA